MNDVLLIHRINPGKEKQENIHQMTFITGDLTEEKADFLLNALSEIEFIDATQAVIKYNGFVIGLAVKDIPRLLKALLIKEIPIFEVYELYDQ